MPRELNTANIDRLIGVIRADKGKHFLMRAWAKWIGKLNDEGRPTHYEPCKTAFCLCGHINHIILTDENYPVGDKHMFQATDWHGVVSNYVDRMGDADKASAWLGISDEQAFRLFYMQSNSQDNGNDVCFSKDMEDNRSCFDKLSASKRANVAVAVLTHLKETGKVDWPKALKANSLSLPRPRGL